MEENCHILAFSLFVLKIFLVVLQWCENHGL